MDMKGREQAAIAAIDKAWELNDIAGLAGGVSGNGLDVLAGRGHADHIEKAPLRTDHVFHFCSVSKLFVVTAILQLA